MTSEFISFDGKVLPLNKCGTQLYDLLKVNYTYRDLHVQGNTPLHMDTQLELIELSFNSLYGYTPALSKKDLSGRIHELLYRCNAPSGSNLVKLILFPDESDGEPHIALMYEGPMIYSGYTLWHRQSKAVLLTYETPFPAYKTAAGYNAHLFSRHNARRQNCDIAITVNYAGEAISAGDDPLFCIYGREVFTTDAITSVPQTTERLLGLELCTLAGLTIHESAVRQDQLFQMDELFTVTTQGIIPIGSVAGKLYPSSLVKVLEEFLPEISDKEFEL